MFGTTLELLGSDKFSKMSEPDLQKSCMYYSLRNDIVPIYGFGDKLSKYKIYPNPLRQGVWDWTTIPPKSINRSK